MSEADFSDIVSINSFQVSANIGADWWGRDRHQPISISVYLHLKHAYLQKAGESDDVRDSVHYGHLCKSLERLVRPSESKFSGLHGLAAEVTNAAFDLGGDAVEKVRVVVEAPKLALMADGVALESTMARGNTLPETSVSVRGLNLAAIIGVNAPERLSKQRVILDLSFFEISPADIDYIPLISSISKSIEESSHLTLEKLVLDVVRSACMSSTQIRAVSARAQKPSALSFASSSCVEITRPRKYFATS